MNNLNNQWLDQDKQVLIDKILVKIWEPEWLINNFSDLLKLLMNDKNCVENNWFNLKKAVDSLWIQSLFNDESFKDILVKQTNLSISESNQVIKYTRDEFKDRLDNVLSNKFENLDIDKDIIESLQDKYVWWWITMSSLFKYIDIFKKLNKEQLYYYYVFIRLDNEIENLNVDNLIKLINMAGIKKVQYFIANVYNKKVVKIINEAHLDFISFLLSSKIPEHIHTDFKSKEVFSVFSENDVDYIIESSHKLKDLKGIFEKLELWII